LPADTGPQEQGAEEQHPVSESFTVKSKLLMIWGFQGWYLSGPYLYAFLIHWP